MNKKAMKGKESWMMKNRGTAKHRGKKGKHKMEER